MVSSASTFMLIAMLTSLVQT